MPVVGADFAALVLAVREMDFSVSLASRMMPSRTLVAAFMDALASLRAFSRVPLIFRPALTSAVAASKKASRKPAASVACLVVGDRRLRVHGPGNDGDLPQLDFPQMPDAVFVVVKDDGVIPDGQLIENSIFQQHFDVASHRSVADFGLDEKAIAVFPQLQRSANGEPAVVVQGEYLYPLPAFGDCLREGSRGSMMSPPLSTFPNTAA